MLYWNAIISYYSKRMLYTSKLQIHIIYIETGHRANFFIHPTLGTVTYQNMFLSSGYENDIDFLLTVRAKSPVVEFDHLFWQLWRNG